MSSDRCGAALAGVSSERGVDAQRSALVPGPLSLKGEQDTPQLVAEHLKAKPEFTNPASRGRAGTCDATKARFIADAAERISQPDTRVGQIRLLAGDAAFATLHPVIPAKAVKGDAGGRGIVILVCQLEPASDMWDGLQDALALLARSDDGARGTRQAASGRRPDRANVSRSKADSS